MIIEKPKKDFFISYNKADKEWAQWIAWELEQVGYSTFLQDWDFRPGSNFVLDMNKYIASSDRMIAVISPDYIHALFVHPEWASAFANDPIGEKCTLIPVIVKDCEIESLLAQIININLVGLNNVAAAERLLEGIRLERTKPQTEPFFPGQ